MLPITALYAGYDSFPSFQSSNRSCADVFDSSRYLSPVVKLSLSSATVNRIGTLLCYFFTKLRIQRLHVQTLFKCHLSKCARVIVRTLSFNFFLREKFKAALNDPIT